MTPAELVSRARGWLGVPFRHQGRTRQGVDCVGLVLVVLDEGGAWPAGFTDSVGYARLPQAGLLQRHVASYCTPAPGPEVGTIGLFRWRQDPQHVALMTDGGLIHSYESIGRVVEHGYRGAWPRRAVSFWYLPGVAYE